MAAVRVRQLGPMPNVVRYGLAGGLAFGMRVAHQCGGDLDSTRFSTWLADVEVAVLAGDKVTLAGLAEEG